MSKLLLGRNRRPRGPIAWPLVLVAVLLCGPATGAPRAELSPGGLGAVRLGMRLQAAADALNNQDLVEIAGRIGDRPCRAIRSRVIDATYGISFIGIASPAIERIDVALPDDIGPDVPWFAREVRTREGIGVGDPMSKVRSVYAHSPHYLPIRQVGAHDVIVPVRGRAEGYAFREDAGVVVLLRAGRLSALADPRDCE